MKRGKIDTYTPEEFRLSCRLRGIARKDIVDAYMKDHAGAIYTEDDFIEVYRKHEATAHDSIYRPNGDWNPSAAENIPNSHHDYYSARNISCVETGGFGMMCGVVHEKE